MNEVFDKITWGYPGHRRATISEFLARLSKITDPAARIADIRDYAQKCGTGMLSFRIFVEGIAHPSVKWGVSEIPPFRSSPYPEECASTLLRLANRFGYLIENSQIAIKDIRRRQVMFASMLESIPTADGIVLIAMINGDLADVGLEYNELKEAFPEWLPDKTPEAKATDMGESAAANPEPSAAKPQPKTPKQQKASPKPKAKVKTASS